MTRIRFLLALATLVAVFAAGARADVTYDAKAGTLTVTGFTAGAPCTVADLRQADADGGWGVVAYNKATDTTTLAAHLLIGRSDGTSSFLRIGAADRPREMLVVTGNVIVTASREIAYKRYEGCNTFMLGMADKSTVRPALLIDCPKRNAFRMEIGAGASLRAFHARIAARATDKAHRANWKGTGNDSRLIGCTLAGFTQLYGFNANHGRDFRVIGTTFSDMDIGPYNGQQYFEDCTFRNMGIAIYDGGGLSGIIKRCRFENNTINWQMQYTRDGLRAVDCTFGKAAKTPGYVCTAWRNKETGEWQKPAFLAERHVVVEVKEATGNVLRGARVRLACEEDAPAAVRWGTAVTGSNGRTPAPDEARALLVFDYLVRAAEKKTPARTDYTYALTVLADGDKPVTVKGLDPDQRQPVVTVRLEH